MISKAVKATSIKNGSGTMAAVGLAAHRLMVMTAKATNKMWPARRFAKSRTASEKGRTRNVETSSMGVTNRYRAFGTPGGKRTCPR